MILLYTVVTLSNSYVLLFAPTSKDDTNPNFQGPSGHSWLDDLDGLNLVLHNRVNGRVHYLKRAGRQVPGVLRKHKSDQKLGT